MIINYPITPETRRNTTLGYLAPLKSVSLYKLTFILKLITFHDAFKM